MKNRQAIENYIERLREYKEQAQDKIDDLREEVEDNAFRMNLEDLGIYKERYTNYVKRIDEMDTMIYTLLWVLEDEVVKPQ